jgi:hypothetical protein
MKGLKLEYLCNLVIPGAAKSGTSTLHDLISLHPDICMSRPKEPQHFSFDDLYSGGAKKHNVFFEKCSNAKFYGESSQCYFFHEHAIERLRESLKEPKIILVLREPLERLFSHYASRYKLGYEKAGLMEAVRKRGWDIGYERHQNGGIYVERGAYLACSNYSKFVPLWLDSFGEKNVLVLTMDALKESQSKFAARCFDFLGLAPISVKPIKPRNATIEKTIRSEYPKMVNSLNQIIPIALKRPMNNFKVYLLVKKFLAKANNTPEPDMRLSEEELQFLCEALYKDIDFYKRYRSEELAKEK